MKTTLTTSAGSPIADDNNSISAGEQGSLTFDNFRLFEKLAHFNRERLPERVVHARGTGAYGTFTLNTSLTDYSIAHFLQKAGQQTEVFVRFSTVGGGQDSSDYARDPRGFAVKFYTEQGNFDLVGNNTPVFFLNDPIKFPDFVHSQKKNPQTNLPDPAAMFEFWANHPQSLHQMTILMSDRGIPLSYRHMHGFGSHTLSFWNQAGERFWVKWHLKTQQGIETVHSDDAHKYPAFGASPDKMLQARLIAYQDAHRYRVGANVNQIPVNAPKCPVNNYQRDGVFAGVCPFSGNVKNGKNSANFYPNDRTDTGAPSPDITTAEPPMPLAQNAWVKPHSQDHEDYYTQAGDLFRLMSAEQQLQVATNIAGGLSAANEHIQQRMLEQFDKADPQYMKAVKAALEALE